LQPKLHHVSTVAFDVAGVRRTEQLGNGCWTADAQFFFGLLDAVVAGYGHESVALAVPPVGHADGRYGGRQPRKGSGEGVTTTETVRGSQTIDNALHLLIEAVEADAPTPGTGVEVTFYLPTGTVMGNLEPCWYFDQKLLHYLQTTGVDHNRQTPNEGTCGKHEFVHLSKVAYQHSGGDINQHDQVRVRLADVHSWAFGRGQLSVKDLHW
jgi:hypothetical protein